MGVGGFEVLGDRLVTGGDTACELAEEVASLRRTWSGTADVPAEACGYTDLTAAYQTMVDAWFAEFGTYIVVLEELCAAIHDAARGYDHSDHTSANALQVRKRAQ
jgi:uncharacterized protein YukE